MPCNRQPCPRCDKDFHGEPLPDWDGVMVCPQCVYDSIPEQPPLSEKRIQELVDFATREDR